MTQRKLDDLFSVTPSSNKRSRITQITTTDRDEFDDLFETNSSSKRRRTNQIDVFDFEPSTNKKLDTTGSLKKKRSITDVDDENKAIDDLFNNDTRKKLRRPIIKTEESTDLLDMFKTKSNINIPQTISTLDHFKTPICPKTSITQKKIKMFFDDTDLISLREQANEQNNPIYSHVKPVLITSGHWLSKEAETKSTCETIDSSNHRTADINIPDDERNLMHIQYASLIVDEQIDKNKKKSKSSSLKPKSLDGKSFQKQLVVSDSAILRKENLQSCYNALLEDINKPRILSNKQQQKSTISKTDENVVSDEEQIDNIDFFDLPTRRKKF